MGFFFKNKKKNKTEETMAQASEVTTETTTADGMILSREGIKLGLPSVSMEEAIIAAGELLRDLGYVDDDYIPAMIRRNEEASVYMGLGLAIPHGTEDAKKNVKKSGIIVMQYPEGVEFNGGTAQLVIGIAGVGDEHLEILAQITEAVTEDEILEKLKTTTDVAYLFFIIYQKSIVWTIHKIENLRVATGQKFKNASSHAHPEDSHTISENPTSDSLLLKSLSKEFQQCASYEIL